MTTVNQKSGIDLSKLDAADPKIKYGCARDALALARKDPAALYPERDVFLGLLDSENRILRWTGIAVLGALAKADRTADIGGWVDRLVDFLNAGNMITANNAIGALGEIAAARPEYRERIASELVKVESYEYATSECRNIAIGKVIPALGALYQGLDDKKPALDFARRQTGNRRPATKKKAEQFLKKYDRPV